MIDYIENVHINNDGVYFENNGLNIDSLRISPDHREKYWRKQGQHEIIKLYNEFNKINDIIEIDTCIYVGHIMNHFGHFLIETFPKLSKIYNMNLPIIYNYKYETNDQYSYNENIITKNNIFNLFKFFHNNFYNVHDQVFFIKKLYIPINPIKISQTISEPFTLKPIIKKIIDYSNKKYHILDIDRLYLMKFKEEDVNLSYIKSSPYDDIFKQISLVSNAKKIYGKLGTNTHISMFGKYNAIVNWTNVDPERKGRFRNQCFCDLIRTYNE